MTMMGRTAMTHIMTITRRTGMMTMRMVTAPAAITRMRAR